MTNPKRIYLSPPDMSGNEMKYIQHAFDQNWVAPLGPNVDAFENILADYCGVNFVAALNSGTAAIHLALIILGIKQSDEVITSSFTFSATANPIVYQGAKPIFIDSEQASWNMDPALLEIAIKDRLSKGIKPKAIILVHLYGMPANMEKIMTIANQYDIPVIEDAAESLGSRFKNKPLGSFGKMAVISFNGNKIITTSGGGALLSNNVEIVEKARFLSTQARDSAPHYQHSQIGYNYRMSNILAGIGCGQMEIIDERVKKRRENYFFYEKELGKLPGLSFLDEPGKEYFSNRWLTTLLIDPSVSGINRYILHNELEKENIETRPLWKPLHLQPVFASYNAYINGISEGLFQHGLCLPSGTNLNENDRQRIVDKIHNIYKTNVSH
jgi:dTDP-4-amino-4,6-dideoxygalactose transaminase